MKRVSIHLIMVLIVALIVAGSTLSTQRAKATEDPPVVLTAQDFVDPSDPQNVLCTLPENGSLLPCHANLLADWHPPEDLSFVTNAPCVSGLANGTYACQRMDMLSLLPLNMLGGGSGNDMWGWTDESTGKEYVIMGRTNGTAFVDISDPFNPIYLGNLPSHTGSSVWRDMKVYQNHAYIVADFTGDHGMQIFDLTRLRDVTAPPVTFSEDAHYDNFGSAHNIVINEESGYAYVVGISSTNGSQVSCAGGLHMIHLRRPLQPTFAGCFSDDGYTHDAQCVMYAGPDPDYQGQEICMASNTDTLTIVDVTDKANPIEIVRSSYSGYAYTHQGWLTEDHHYFLLDDELDESTNNPNARTYIWDVSDLDNPNMIGTYTATESSIDHNLYVSGDLAFQANYQSGLRMLDISNIGSADLDEVAWFDVYVSGNNIDFNGAWSNYPYFESGVVAVSGIEQGLFLLRPWYRSFLDGSEAITAVPGTIATHTLFLRNVGSQPDLFNLTVQGSWGATIVSDDSFTLGAGETMEIEVTVTVPTDGQVGEENGFTVRARSVNAQSSMDLQAGGTTIVAEIADITVPDSVENNPDEPALAGEVVSHLLSVTNSGNVPDTFQLTASSSEWEISYPSSTSQLASGESEMVEVMVTVPDGYATGEQSETRSDSFTLTIVSSNDELVRSEVVVTTTAVYHPETRYIFLPIIQK